LNSDARAVLGRTPIGMLALRAGRGAVELAWRGKYNAPREVILRDVNNVLQDFADKRVMSL